MTIALSIVAALAIAFAIRERLARRAAQHDRAQREDLLRAIVEAAPMAIVLFAENGKIAFTNPEARELFFEGRALDGENFLGLLRAAPDPLRRAVLADQDELVTTEADGVREVWALAKRNFKIGRELHTLLLVKHLTAAVDRQEVATWRRIIRVLSHEMNNSLAPVRSLVHSARLLAPNDPKLTRVFDTIGERAEHLKTFLEGYAAFARLPKPRKQDVPLGPLLDRIVTLFPVVKLAGTRDATVHLDPGQIEQVLINLVKNAREAGSEDVELEVEAEGGGARFAVRDRGQGLSAEVMENAVQPFYSTKEGGSGLGLSLAREIVDAHGGRLRLRNREGGGAEVSFRIPPRSGSDEARAKLTLTRA